MDSKCKRPLHLYATASGSAARRRVNIWILRHLHSRVNFRKTACVPCRYITASFDLSRPVVPCEIGIDPSAFIGLNRGQYFFGVALWLDLGEYLQESLVRTDDEGCALDADHFPAVHVLFLEHPKLIAHLFVYICEERIRQVELFPEFALCFGRVAGDSEDDGAGFLELFKGIAEAAGFDGAARRIRLGIKEEYDRLSGEVGEMDGLVLIVLEGEVGNFFVQFHERFLDCALWREGMVEWKNADTGTR